MTGQITKPSRDERPPRNDFRGHREPRDREYRENRRVRSRDQRFNDRGGNDTLFVGNLNYDTDEHSLRDYFKQIGKINDVRLALTYSGKSKGFAHIEFKYREDVNKAI